MLNTVVLRMNLRATTHHHPGTPIHHAPTLPCSPQIANYPHPPPHHTHCSSPKLQPIGADAGLTTAALRERLHTDCPIAGSGQHRDARRHGCDRGRRHRLGRAGVLCDRVEHTLQESDLLLEQPVLRGHHGVLLTQRTHLLAQRGTLGQHLLRRLHALVSVLGCSALVRLTPPLLPQLGEVHRQRHPTRARRAERRFTPHHLI
mmetsp:Transcript_67750/g.151254  ORF Transcript_67750/g.151254 Transcript_67750/m.151254 type:complete len:203 (+) Transcript_67750:127-735(+)